MWKREGGCVLSQWISQGTTPQEEPGITSSYLVLLVLKIFHKGPQMFYLALALMKRLLITEITESSWEGWKCDLTAVSARVLLFSKGTSGPGRISFSL